MSDQQNKINFGDDVDITGIEQRGPEKQANELPDEVIVGGESNDNPDNNQPPADQGQPPVETNTGGDEPPVDNQPPVENQIELNDDLVFEYLSKSQGKEIKSLDDLIVREEVNPLDNDPYMKGLFEWRQKTGRNVEEYFEFQKDWSKENDLTVARKYLQIKYPNFDDSEIDYEMRKITPTEEDYEDDAIAKKIELKKLATEGRAKFTEFQADLGNPTEVRYSPEVQQDLELAKLVKQDYQSNQQRLAEYGQGIVQASQNMQTIPLKITEDLSIDFAVSEDRRKSLPEMIGTMPNWHNEDGSWNHAKVVEDGLKALYFDEILKVAVDQAFNAGQEAVLKQGNNTVTTNPTPMSSENNNRAKDIVVEGQDDLFNKRGHQIRFGKGFGK
jgi:hypothetical protein